MEQQESGMTQALRDVVAERQRQVSVEGWTPEHDDQHWENEMARAAECYVSHYRGRGWTYDESAPSVYCDEEAPNAWPWDEQWWKPKNPRRDLVRAAALLIAEIERLDRAAISKATASAA